MLIQSCASSNVYFVSYKFLCILKLEMEIYFYSSAALYSRCTGSY